MTPKEQNFFMPAEWEKHAAVWLAWPHDETTFPNRLEKTEKISVEIIKNLHFSEQVRLLTKDLPMRRRATELLKTAGVNLANITFYDISYADVWIRDYGPIFLVNQKRDELGWVKWVYNGYGKSDDPYFAPLLIDNQVFNKISPPGKKFEPGIVLEGGAIEVNGQGLCLATEQSLLNQNRNPNLSKTDAKKYLDDYLGVKKTVWLKRGLINDHTDGHIDELARFVSEKAVVCAYEDDPQDENYKILDDNYQALKSAADLNGQPFKIVKLPMPHMLYDNGAKAPVSYCNFYIGNQAILAPTFNDQNDAAALAILQSLFPDRKVVGIDCRDVIYGGGGIHCMTQQQPEV